MDAASRLHSDVACFHLCCLTFGGGWSDVVALSHTSVGLLRERGATAEFSVEAMAVTTPRVPVDVLRRESRKQTSRPTVLVESPIQHYPLYMPFIFAEINSVVYHLLGCFLNWNACTLFHHLHGPQLSRFTFLHCPSSGWPALQVCQGIEVVQPSPTGIEALQQLCHGVFRVIPRGVHKAACRTSLFAPCL